MSERDWLNKFERLMYQRVQSEKTPITLTVSEEIKSKSKDILSIEQVRKLFNSYWYSSYYDFYFTWIENFKRIIKDNKLSLYYNKNSWEKFNHITLRWIEIFWRFLWFGKLTFNDTKEYILSKLSWKWVRNIKELLSYWLYNLKNDFSSDKIFLHFFIEVMKKPLWKIVYEDYILFWDKLWLCELNNNELKESIINVLKENNIIYQEDLEKIDVYTFRSTLGNNLLIEYYFFYIKKISRTKVSRKDIDNLWKELWLKRQNKKDIISSWIKELLYSYGIKSYADLKSFWKIEIRTILWQNKAAMIILKEFWLADLSKFREEHLKRFARRIWLTWVPDDFKYDKNKSKAQLLKLFREKGISSVFCLEFYWIKNIKRVIRRKNNPYFHDVSPYIKKMFWKTIPNLSQFDLEKLGIDLWLPKFLEEKEYKKRFLSLLSRNSITLESLTCAKVISNSYIWDDVNFRFFIQKFWTIADISKLRKYHIDAFINYIKSLN